jgi:cellulose synthase/poly-beta-1,6-N-acetylglucosamine synthase-like glycosyltransferase
MLARHFRPWLTSGACFLARTDALRLIMARHSMWTPGEDIETGRVALALRMRIRHLDIVVHTDAPVSWRGLIRQRQLWWAGSFRHWWINFDRNLLHLPLMTSYYLAAIWFSVVFKWWTMVDPRDLIANLPILICAYIFVTAISNLQVLSPWMIVFPFYSLAQVAIMPPLGAFTYIRLASSRRRLGRYPFGYRRRRPLESFPSPGALSALEARLSWFVTEPRLEHRPAGVPNASW